MLSTKPSKLYELFTARNDIHIGMQNDQPKFSDYVREKAHNSGLSYRELADKSGGLLAHSTISDIINERTSNNPTYSVIKGIAKMFDVTEQEVFDIVRGKVSDSELIENERYQNIADNVKKLEVTDKKEIEVIVRILEREVFERQSKTRKTLDPIQRDFENDLTEIELDPNIQKKKRAKK